MSTVDRIASSRASHGVSVTRSVDAAPPAPVAPLLLPRRPGFEPNHGQWPDAVRFTARDGAITIALTPEAAVWQFRAGPTREVQTLRMRWLGGNPLAVIGSGATGARVHRYHGADESTWHSDIPLYARVTYREVYPGIDLVFHDERGTLEYDFIVSPGADPGQIRLTFEGVEHLSLSATGELELGNPRVIRHHAPIVSQHKAGAVDPVPGRYVIGPGADASGPVLAFAVGAYDPTATLVIDPSVTYSTTVVDDGVNQHSVLGMAVDRDGSIWLAGATTSKTFPISDDAIDQTFLPEDFDEGFALKLDPAGALVYATYLGGRLFDGAGGIAIDGDGNVFIAGTTISDDFPTTLNAYQPELASAGTEDNFLVKLDSSGRLVASTYFGGNSRDLFPAGGRGFPGAAVALAGDGGVYLAGGTISTDLPASQGHQRQFGGGSQDAFLAKFTSSLGFERCTYLGGTNNEGAYRIALDASDNVYLLGAAARLFGESWSFPVTPGAYLTAPSGDPLLFVAKFDPGGALAYATFLGPDAGDGNLFENQGDIAVDAAGNAYVVGVTGSATYPVTPGAFQTNLRGFSDLFVSKLDPTGARLVYSTYFGGSAAEYGDGDVGVRIVVNAEGQAYIAGHTDSLDLPEKDAFEPTKSGRFITKLDASGTDFVYSSYLRFQNMSIDALALAPSPSGDGAAGATGTVAVYVAGPTVEPRGLAVIGIDESTTPAECPGDCDGDGFVRVNELVAGVRVALEQAAVATCMSFDTDGDGRVSVNELVRGVGSLLRGCG
jgi:hypothetical protein